METSDHRNGVANWRSFTVATLAFMRWQFATLLWRMYELDMGLMAGLPFAAALALLAYWMGTSERLLWNTYIRVLILDPASQLNNHVRGLAQRLMQCQTDAAFDATLATMEADPSNQMGNRHVRRDARQARVLPPPGGVLPPPYPSHQSPARADKDKAPTHQRFVTSEEGSSSSSDEEPMPHPMASPKKRRRVPNPKPKPKFTSSDDSSSSSEDEDEAAYQDEAAYHQRQAREEQQRQQKREQGMRDEEQRLEHYRANRAKQVASPTKKRQVDRTKRFASSDEDSSWSSDDKMPELHDNSSASAVDTMDEIMDEDFQGDQNRALRRARREERNRNTASSPDDEVVGCSEVDARSAEQWREIEQEAHRRALNLEAASSPDDEVLGPSDVVEESDANEDYASPPCPDEESDAPNNMSQSRMEQQLTSESESESEEEQEMEMEDQPPRRRRTLAHSARQRFTCCHCCQTYCYGPGTRFPEGPPDWCPTPDCGIPVCIVPSSESDDERNRRLGCR
jgi:hypothetical protein